MKCPNCENQTHITKATQERDLTTRTRECPKCGEKFDTVEIAINKLFDYLPRADVYKILPDYHFFTPFKE